jgi:hypothetical protein
MPVKKRVTKKRTTRSKITGIASYVKKVFSSPPVKKAAATIKTLEAKLKAAKKAKAAAVKIARKKIK